jgi:Mlc titration factor MtfA (ptsG expression regulator)
VLSEVFFASPATLVRAYPDVYAQLAAFYRQDPAARAAVARRPRAVS